MNVRKVRKRSTGKTTRADRGNMLVFITASTFIIIGGLAFFALGYVRLLGTNNEQRTAIEAAALSAARDISRIVIDTPEYGWISLSDSAPNGAYTIADDDYYLPVRGINTIIGSNRVCRIIAEELNDDWLKVIVDKDLDMAKQAQAKLKAELVKSLAPGYVAKDANNQDVEVYKNAEAAYNSNGVRMTGSSSYVAGTLKLSLGSLSTGTVTNTPTPKPAGKAQVPAAAKQNGFYLSYTNIPVGGSDYVFAGIGDSIKLVDAKKWVASAPGLPYQMQTIVKAEADQQMNGHEVQGYKVHAVACAQPANVTDPKPAPGAFTFSFPDGLVPEIPNPGAMLTHARLNAAGGAGCSYVYADNGDFPVETGTSLKNMPFPYSASLPCNSGVVFRRGLVDWWKRAGTKLHINSAVAMLTDPNYNFKPPTPTMVNWKTPTKAGGSDLYDLGPIPNGNIHVYRIDPNSGMISYQAKQLDPIEIPVAADNQLYSECIDAIKKSSVGKYTVGPFMYPDTGDLFDMVYLLDTWDCYIRDYIYQPGAGPGGQHGGEPLNHPKTAFASPTPGLMEIGSGSLGARRGGGWGRSWNSPPPVGTPQPYNPPGIKGKGKPPAITAQTDLAETAGYPTNFYQNYSVGSGVRPTYTTNGMAVDVRFRRQVDPGTFSDVLGIKIGYVGEKYGDAVPSKTMLPYVPPPDPVPVPDPTPTPTDPPATDPTTPPATDPVPSS